MTFSPLPPYFIVKINKETQSQRKEKIGMLYLHFKEVFMQRNMQCGEIVGIGKDAKNIFPDSKIGDTVLFHHFVEGDSKKSNLIFQDKEYNYYYVTTSDFNGHRNETYGIFDGEKIIPHPEFIFIKDEEEVKEGYEDNEDFINKNTKQVGSLILFNNWTESRDVKEEKAKTLMAEIKNQSKGKSMSDSTKRGLEEKQKDAESITASLNKREYKLFDIEYYPKSMEKKCNANLEDKKGVYVLSLAAHTELDFLDKKYKVLSTKYCCATA